MRCRRHIPMLALALALMPAAAAGVRAAEPEASKSWAFEPVTRPLPPQPSDRRWPRGAIDAFVLSRLERDGLRPAPEAPRRSLVRRLYLDLAGLLPEPEDVDAFVADDHPAAYERLADRLLASPRFGERWARHWLDLARFCESHGFEYDKLREHAWPYRDYVIDAFNGDKPYNQFVREQVAGDVLEPATREGIVATTFLVCGAWDEAGNIQANAALRAQAREEELEDIVGAVAQTFLGVTVNCARCHDHKFDPVPQADYYRLRSVLSGVRHGERPLETAAESRERQERVKELKAQKAIAEARLLELDREGRRLALAARGVRLTPLAATLPELRPVARWTFDGGAGDVAGGLESSLEGGATVRDGRLVLDGDGAFLRSAPIGFDLAAKTLSAWVMLDGLDQGGGAVLSIEAPDGSAFDAIVYGERRPGRWMVGSENFRRTRDLEAPAESSGAGELIHIAAVFQASGEVALHRNGKPYGEAYRPAGGSGPAAFRSGAARFLLGKRHTGGGRAFLRGAIEEAAVYDRALSPAEVAALHGASGLEVPAAEVLAALSPADRSEIQRLQELCRELEAAIAALPAPRLAYTGSREHPAATRLLARGEASQPQALVVPGGLEAVRDPAAQWGLGPEAPEPERRRMLASWMTHPRHPLTARVAVNRLWQHHFGLGLVATPNDFGAAGARPSHPALLDWLACELVEGEWSLKRIHRAMVCSAAYRQSSRANDKALEVDAEGLLLWRWTPRRLEAEAIRDAILGASGQLNLAMGGPSYRDFEHIAFPAATYAPIDRDDPALNRRSVYRMNVQSGKSPLLETFDCPEASVKTPRRGATTTPAQALALLSSPWAVRAAERLAARAGREAREGESPVDRAWRLVLGRRPAAAEAEAAGAVAREHGMATVCWALLNASELLHVE